MKKFVFALMVALLVVAMAVPAFADTDFDVPWKVDPDSSHVVHVSYDEVIPGIVCSQDAVKIETPEIAAGTKEVTFRGWIGSDKESVPVAFSYSVNGGEAVKSTAWNTVTEDAVVTSAQGSGATYAQRFDVKVPIDADGTRVVRVYAEFENGTHELIWVAELTVGEATDFTDAGDTYTDDAVAKDLDAAGDEEKPDEGDKTPDEGEQKPDEGDKTPDNAGTADTASVIFMIAAAAMIVTVVMKKRENA